MLFFQLSVAPRSWPSSGPLRELSHVIFAGLGPRYGTAWVVFWIDLMKFIRIFGATCSFYFHIIVCMGSLRGVPFPGG